MLLILQEYVCSSIFATKMSGPLSNLCMKWRSLAGAEDETGGISVSEDVHFDEESHLNL